MSRRAVVIGGMPRALPAVTFKRYRSARALAEVFFLPMGGFENIVEAPALVRAAKEMRVWAFCARDAKPCPVVHYWHAEGVDRLHLAYVLGHEVGHISGRPLRSRRNAWREELRADEYGAGAYLALQHVLESEKRQARDG